MSDWKTAIEQPKLAAQGDSDNPTLEESIKFGPRRRPCYPQLIVVDDQSSETGEIVRIRRDSLTLGRAGCDLSFPAEGLMSGMHAKISLQQISANHWSWVLEDLSSRNGVYVRLTEFRLCPGNEFLIGGTKVVVHGDMTLNASTPASIPSVVPFVANANQIRKEPELEVSSYLFSQVPTAISLRGKKLQIGRQAVGASAFAIDPFVEPVHASIEKLDSCTWQIVDKKSLNGVWLRVERMILTSSASFMLGEQRFRFLSSDGQK